MNISEFERTKNEDSLKFIESCIKKYTKEKNKAFPIMDQKDGVFADLSLEIIKDLEKIKKSFS